MPDNLQFATAKSAMDITDTQHVGYMCFTAKMQLRGWDKRYKRIPPSWSNCILTIILHKNQGWD